MIGGVLFWLKLKFGGWFTGREASEDLVWS